MNDLRKIIQEYNLELLKIMKQELQKEDFSTKEVVRLSRKIIQDMKELERQENNS